jgi:hypothetical protein
MVWRPSEDSFEDPGVTFLRAANETPAYTLDVDAPGRITQRRAVDHYERQVPPTPCPTAPCAIFGHPGIPSGVGGKLSFDALNTVDLLRCRSNRSIPRLRMPYLHPAIRTVAWRCHGVEARRGPTRAALRAEQPRSHTFLMP